MYEDLINSFKTQASIEIEPPNINLRFCTECKQHGILNERRFECKKCGKILAEDFINRDIDWRSQDSCGDMTHKNERATKIDELMPFVSMSTRMIGGNKISDFRMKKVHGWISMPYSEKSLSKVFKCLTLKTTQANMNKKILQFSKS